MISHNTFHTIFLNYSQKKKENVMINNFLPEREIISPGKNCKCLKQLLLKYIGNI